MLIAFTVEAPYRRLAARWGRPALAAAACTVGTAILFFVTMASLGYLLVGRGGWEFVQEIAHRGGIEQISLEDVTGRIVDAAGEIAKSVAGIGARIASA